MSGISQRGLSLPYVLVMGFVAFVIMSSVLGLVSSNARQVSSRMSHETASRYAFNAFQLAAARLKDNPSWGKAPSDTLSASHVAGDPEDARGVVTFETASADRSVNNVEGTDATKSPEGLTLPVGSAYLRAVGECGGVRSVCEGVLAVQPFPFSVASSGPLITSGSFLTGSIDDPSVLDQGGLDLQKVLKRGSILSNAGGVSVNLSGSPVNVTGDVVCVGSATLGGNVVIGGEKKEFQQPKAMPTYRVAPRAGEVPPVDLYSKTFPADGKGVRHLDAEVAPGTGDLRLKDPLEGFAQYVSPSGQDLVVSGDLKMAEAIVYVKGNLRVTGALSGVGALLCTGNVNLGSTSIGAIEKMAVVADGSITVAGAGRSSSRIVGLLMSGGDLTLRDVTVVGAVVCAGGEGQSMRLTNVDAYGSTRGTDFQFSLAWTRATSHYFPPTSRQQGGTLRLARIKDHSTGQMRTPMPSDFASRYRSGMSSADLIQDSDFELVITDSSGHEVVRTLASAGVSLSSPEYGNWLNILVTPLRDEAFEVSRESPRLTVSQGSLHLDLNKFLRLGDTLQLSYRRLH